MDFKQIIWKLKHGSILRILKYCFLFILLTLLLTITFFYCKCSLLPTAKIILKPLAISAMSPVTKIDPQTIFEAILNGANFAIVYISILLAVTALIITFVSFWWGRKLSILEKCNQDYERFKQNYPLEARLTTAKIFVIDSRFSEAWEQIKDLPDDFSYEVPLFKAKILVEQPHDDSVFSTSIKLLNKALSFPKITPEIKSIIFRDISRVWFKEKRDYKKALEYAEKAIEEDCTHWSAHNAKALALRHLGNLEEAITVLKEIIKENKKYETAYYNLACYFAQKLRKETDPREKPNLKDAAISNYKISIKLEPKNKKIAKTDTDLDPIRSEIENL